MKQSCVAVLILLFSLSALSAQTEYGVKGGLNFTFSQFEEGNFGKDTNVQIGYYFGGFANFEIENDFYLQPEILYIGLGDFKFLNAPIYLKYNVKNNFNILVGPSINYFFDFFNAKLKIRADLALTYNVSSKLELQMKYTIGFEEITPNGVFLGLGYKL